MEYCQTRGKIGSKLSRPMYERKHSPRLDDNIHLLNNQVIILYWYISIVIYVSIYIITYVIGVSET